jgi:hypothetical protein
MLMYLVSPKQQQNVANEMEQAETQSYEESQPFIWNRQQSLYSNTDKTADKTVSETKNPFYKEENFRKYFILQFMPSYAFYRLYSH